MEKRMGKGGDIRMKEVSKGWKVLDKDTLFTKRKKELMNRDPLVAEFMKNLRAYNPKKDDPPEAKIQDLKKGIFSQSCG